MLIPLRTVCLLLPSSSFVDVVACLHLSIRPRRLLHPECTRTRFLNTCTRYRKCRRRRKCLKPPLHRLVRFYTVHLLFSKCFLTLFRTVCRMWALLESWDTSRGRHDPRMPWWSWWVRIVCIVPSPSRLRRLQWSSMRQEEQFKLEPLSWLRIGVKG